MLFTKRATNEHKLVMSDHFMCLFTFSQLFTEFFFFGTVLKVACECGFYLYF